MSLVGLVVVDSLAWIAISVLAGFTGSLLPDRLLTRDSFVTRIRPFEAGGSRWRSFGVHRWKDALPETNSVGVGSRRSKRHLAGRASLPDFIVETRRAEYVHLMIAAAGPLFLVWNPVALGLAMIVFGVLFNAPFVMVQRYNRARFVRVVARLETRS